MSRIDRSQSSKHLASTPAIRTKTSITLYFDVYQTCLPRSQQLTNFIWHNPMYTKQTKNHRPQLIYCRTMKKKAIHRFPTPFIHKAPLQLCNMPFAKRIQENINRLFSELLIVQPNNNLPPYALFLHSTQCLHNNNKR